MEPRDKNEHWAGLPDDVRVLALLEQGNFADCGRWDAFLVRLEFDLLQRIELFVRLV